MTLAELNNAIEGYNEKNEDELQWQLYNSRMISYYAIAAHLKRSAGVRKPADLFELNIDIELRRRRLKKLKPIKVIPRDQ